MCAWRAAVMADQDATDHQLAAADTATTAQHAVLPIKQIIEAALLVSPEPLSLDRLQALFGDDTTPGETVPSRRDLQEMLAALAQDCADRGYELVNVASGWRFQVRQALAPWIARMYTERPSRYSRALLETLALVAYRQPVTRGDIEEVRGVAVSTGIMRTLLERNWIRVVAHREVPGRPALYGTTKEFLDYFNLQSLEDLPSLGEVRDLDEMGRDLEMSLGLELDSVTGASISGHESAIDDAPEAVVTAAEQSVASEGSEANASAAADRAVDDAAPLPSRSAVIVTLEPRERRDS